MSKNHRHYKRVYEHCYGPVPIDHKGRKYDIHHIDGNHANTHPANLQAVTIREHYYIHKKQKDWGACHAIAMRMEISPSEFSEICRRNAKVEMAKRIKNGTHNFNSEHSKRVNQMRLDKGTHNFLDHGPHKKIECPHCGKIGGENIMHRWHFSNCRYKNGK